MTLIASKREIATSYNIRYVDGSATAFCWRDEQGTFLVTAAHVLKGAAKGDVVELRRRTDWARLAIREVLFAPSGVDICVFTTENFGINFRGEYKSSPGLGLGLGADVLFVGYPHGLVNDTPPINGDLPTALVRKASFSGVIDTGSGHPTMIFDGFNNPGYSGSPIYVEDNGHLRPMAVVSGYRHELSSHGGVYREKGDGDEERLPDVYVKPNSGMIYAYSWGYVQAILADLKTRNPPGPPEPTLAM